MRRVAHFVGDALMVLGVGLGIALAPAILVRDAVPNVPWLVVISMVKLGFISSLGLIAAGGFLRRLSRRAEDRRRAIESDSRR